MIDTIVAGGWVMIPIGLCSVVALAAFLERAFALRRSRVVPRAFVAELLELLQRGAIDQALALCAKWDVAAARVIEVAIRSRHLGRAAMKERLEEVGRREGADMERFVPIVGTVAAISPLLGLLGTVGGMIVTFAVIQEQGLGNVDSLAAGISQALITTFAGLTVGIPALVANRWLLARVDRLLIELEEVSLDALELLGGAGEAAPR